MPIYNFRSNETSHEADYFLTHGQVDRLNSVIHGVVAMAEGEARGHGVWADRTTLEITRNLGNEAGDRGIRQRLGHPGISENATAKQIAVARDFSVENDKLVHSMDLLSFARKSPVFTTDVVEFVMEMAETRPEYMGESVVIVSSLFWVLDDGSERELSDNEYDQIFWRQEVKEVPADAVRPQPSMRPLKLHFVDLVNEGALTPDGMFNADPQLVQDFFSGRSSEFAQELYALVDRWRGKYGVSLPDTQRKALQMIQRYIHSREAIGGSTMKKRQGLDRRALGRAAAAQGNGKPGITPASLLDLDDESVDGQPVVDEPGESESQDEVVSQSDEEVDDDSSVDETLDETEELLDETEEPEEPTDSDAPAVEELAMRVIQLSAICEAQQAQIDAQQQQLTRATDLLNKLTKRVVANHANIEAADRNIRRLSGEHVVTQRVPSTRKDPLDALFDYTHPDPTESFSFSGGTPTHPENYDALTDDSVSVISANDSPAMKAAKLQTKRQRAYHNSR